MAAWMWAARVATAAASSSLLRWEKSSGVLGCEAVMES